MSTVMHLPFVRSTILPIAMATPLVSSAPVKPADALTARVKEFLLSNVNNFGWANPDHQIVKAEDIAANRKYEIDLINSLVFQDTKLGGKPIFFLTKLINATNCTNYLHLLTYASSLPDDTGWFMYNSTSDYGATSDGLDGLGILHTDANKIDWKNLKPVPSSLPLQEAVVTAFGSAAPSLSPSSI